MQPDQPESQNPQIVQPSAVVKPDQENGIEPGSGKHKYWSKPGLVLILLLIVVGGVGTTLYRHKLTDTSNGQDKQVLTSDQKADKKLLEHAQADLGFDKPTSGGYTVNDCKDARPDPPCFPSQGMDLIYKYSKKWPSLIAFTNKIKSKGWKDEGVDNSQIYSFYKVINGKPVCVALRSISSSTNLSDLNPLLNELSVGLQSDCTDYFANLDKLYNNFAILVPQNVPSRYITRKQNISRDTKPDVNLIYEVDNKGDSPSTNSSVTISEDNTQNRTIFYRCTPGCKTVLTTPKGTVVKEFFNDNIDQQLVFQIANTYIMIDRDVKPTTASERLSDTELASLIDSMKTVSPEQLNKLYPAI